MDILTILYDLHGYLHTVKTLVKETEIMVILLVQKHNILCCETTLLFSCLSPCQPLTICVDEPALVQNVNPTVDQSNCA